MEKKMFKIDFDLDSLDESNDLYSDEEYNADKINSKSKKIILDEDNDEDSIKPGNNIVPNLKEIRLEINRENKSKKNTEDKYGLMLQRLLEQKNIKISLLIIKK